MTHGYELIEPEGLARLLALTDPTCTVALLHWMASEIIEELGDELGGAELVVVRADYMGPYPCLAVRHVQARGASNLAPAVEAIAQRLCRAAPLSRFLRFLAESDRDWSSVAHDLLRPAAGAEEP